MTAKQQAEDKINAAAKGCEEAVRAWQAAESAISGTISINGYGVHHDRDELRYKLLKAQEHIKTSLAALDRVEWPSNADYNAAD